MSTSTHTNSTHSRSTTSAKTGGQDKLAALDEQISDGVAALVDSEGVAGDAGHRREVPQLQREPAADRAEAPQASRVAGFRSWQSVGRQVRKGERGIAILAPCTYRPKTAEQAEPTAPADQEPAATCSGGAVPAAGGKQVRGFGWCTCSRFTRPRGRRCSRSPRLC